MILYVGLGSNLGNRKENLLRAIALIANRVGRIEQVSSFVETPPWGFESAHPFLNSVVAVATDRSAEAVLPLVKAIECEMGRVQRSAGMPYADRPIDIDLLLMGDLIIETEELTLPHPHLADRLFVLEPLAEIAPELLHPVYGKTMIQLLAEKA